MKYLIWVANHLLYVHHRMYELYENKNNLQSHSKICKWICSIIFLCGLKHVFKTSGHVFCCCKTDFLNNQKKSTWQIYQILNKLFINYIFLVQNGTSLNFFQELNGSTFNNDVCNFVQTLLSLVSSLNICSVFL